MTGRPLRWPAPRDADPQRLLSIAPLAVRLQQAEDDYDRDPSDAALDAAADAWRELRGHPAWPALPAGLTVALTTKAATMLRERYERHGRAADVQDALAAARAGVTAAAAGSDENRAQASRTLGSVLTADYEVQADDAVLDEAATALEAALAGVPDAPPPWRAAASRDLAAALLLRVKARGAREDADRAIAALDAALALPGGPLRGVLLDARGCVLLARAELGVGAGDVAAAVTAFEEAVSLDPSPWHRANLAAGLSARARTTGDRSDAERATRLIDAALGSLPAGMPDRHRVEQMAVSRAAVPGEAVAAARRLVGAAPAGTRRRVLALATLGRALFAAARGAGRRDLLPEAATVLERALAEAGPGHDWRPSLLSDLGLVHLERHVESGAPEDLRRAVTLAREAVAGVRPGSWERAELLHNLGLALSLQAAASGDPADAAAATATFRDACAEGARGNVRSALLAGSDWGSWAFEEGADDDAAEAWTAAAEAADRLYPLQLGRDRKTATLAEARLVAANAGYALAQVGRPQDAVVVMERGRARLLGDALDRERAELGTLAAAGHADLADRFVDCAARVTALELDGEDAGGSGEERDRARRDARAELDRATAAVRAVPGLAGFLVGTTFADVAAVARTGPVTFLAATDVGGVAVTVRADGSTTVTWLPDLTHWSVVVAGGPLLGVVGGADARRDQLPAVLDWLGEVAMRPLLEDLGDVGSLTLVPLGALTLLPLHAASWADGDGGRHHVLDRVTVTYAPSARVAATCRAAAAARDLRPALVIGVAATATAPPIPHAEVEARAVAALFGGTPLTGEQVTRDRVLDAFASAGLLHLACHGRAELGAPLRSALLLAGEDELSLRDLLERGGTRARLAVLSACQTGIAGTELPDEAVHLASGFLQAGAAGVVASLWSVPDQATGLLMLRFHQELASGRPPEEALRQAQLWVRDASSGEKLATFPDALADVAARVGTGRLRSLWASGRTHRHPQHWAAFTYLGG
ncbi:CHAT domain-containing protein [Blastococcus sp. VKM Ac-2987]|uniref:CHAT domain-containing protein n=1 Tax=Blastococcus sp. VKM Ac-2987 TaxID=3004141 RepID=UPI0022AB7527|nr:CHAT domain-containing protein [Blastococcus sp. VKM Ac-2987]MCZ2860992.1 CHAT domain-containing protein [Blastococcus sp. VKM Ac-2987]